MKYLSFEICQDPECSMDWRNLYDAWFKEYTELVVPRMPKRFVKAFEEEHFHDNSIDKIHLEEGHIGRKYVHNMKMVLTDGYKPRVIHYLTLEDISHYKAYMDFQLPGGCDWLYCEWLPVGDKRMSLEVGLSDGYSFYVEFSKLKYRQEKKKV